MHDHPILGQLALGCSPVIDAQRSVIGTRVTVFPDRPEAPLDAAALLVALGEVWPPLDRAAEAPAAGIATGTIVLNLVGESAVRSMLAARPSAPFAVEVPAFMLADAEVAAEAQALHEAGGALWIKGRLSPELSPALLACFGVLVLEVGDAIPPARPRLKTVTAGVRTGVEVEAALKQGSTAALGWPLEDPVPAATGRTKVTQDMQVVLELINRVDREEPLERLEATLKGDPSLAFRLMRYLNSAAFGLTVEINSFRHALMLLGYQKLKRWLALLLASSSKDVNVKPVMYAAVRRGLLMEELARSAGDAEMRGEMFICGVFSLLDRMLKQPFDELLRSVPVPERVRQALGSGDGPFAPYLELVRAIELGSAYDVRELAERLMLTQGEINRALLAAWRAAQQLDA